VSDNPDGRAILASLLAYLGPTADDVDIPLAALPCLRLDALSAHHEGLWVA